VDRLARLVRWLGATPSAQLVLGAAIVMLAFPATPAGTFARLVVFGALGVAIAWAWPQVPAAIRAPSPRAALTTVLGIVALAWLTTFWPVLAHSPSPEWQTGDWGPQHAVLANLMPHLPGLDVPVWNHLVSTGDAPLELYPALTYVVTGHLALLLGLEHDLPHALMIVAALVHLGLALTTTALAARVATKPIAVVIGLFWLVDTGAISHGGTVGLFQWAILHSAFAHVFSMIAALGIVAALVRPRIGSSVAIWLGIAISTAAHPAALITTAAFAVALVGVAVLATDVPPRRALAALLHLAIGLALGAVVWLPAAERLLAYGQHYPNELYSAVQLLQLVMRHAMPITAYSPIVYAGYLAIVVGPWTRRAEVVFVAIVGLVLMLGLCDSIYVALGLAPGKSVARLGAIRLMLLVRPFLFAGAAFVIAALVAGAHARWGTATRTQRSIAAALLGVIAGTLVRVVPMYWSAETDRAVAEASRVVPDLDGQLQLEAWAAGEAANMTPARFGRALFESSSHEHFHLTAKTGLPTLHLPPIPDLLLRERIEDDSADSLARFNVRWAVKWGASPSHGDPASERLFGNYRVRELAGWDGKLARIERGTGTVEVVRIAADVVEIDVSAPGPVLVALGMGYYPRWRATHASGVEQPVYAQPSIPGGKLHVISAWVAPGRTTLSCDGELPSDGRGRIPALLAALLAIAGVVAWRIARWRIRVLRRLARLRASVRARRGRIVAVSVPLLVVGLIAGGAFARLTAAPAFLVGSSGLRPVAAVEARLGDGDDWQPCRFSPVTGIYRCAGIASVSDGTVNVLNDQPPSWPFITPAVVASPESPGVEVRISRELRLGGRYWLAAAGAARVRARLGADAEVELELETKKVLDIPPGTYDITFTAKLPDVAPVEISLVEESTLVPARPFLVPPPSEPPASVTAIGR
jgi:hypothetical protein